MTCADLFQRATGDRRSVDLEQLVALLHHDSARALDVLAGPAVLASHDGNLLISGAEPQITADGVTTIDGPYALADLAIDGLAEKLSIPGTYLQRLHRDRDLHPLFDANVNGWLQRHTSRFLLRILRVDDPTGTDGVHGRVRAALSDRYQRMDHLDMLMAALDGVRRAGVDVTIDGCDLTDRRMYVRVYSPAVAAQAPTLLARYRSPFDSRPGSELPVVWGGFEIVNSETGCGAFTVQPRLMVQVCRNGLVQDVGRIRKTHVGARRDDDGIVDWSHDTDQAHQALLTAQVRDAVRTYLSPQFVTEQVRQLEQTATTRITQPDTTLRALARDMRWTEQQQQDILAHFIAGADLTAGGVMHAVSSLAQTVPSADLAYDLERQAIPAMRRAAALAA